MTHLRILILLALAVTAAQGQGANFRIVVHGDSLPPPKVEYDKGRKYSGSTGMYLAGPGVAHLFPPTADSVGMPRVFDIRENYAAKFLVTAWDAYTNDCRADSIWMYNRVVKHIPGIVWREYYESRIAPTLPRFMEWMRPK